MKRVAFDIGGVLSKFPNILRPLVEVLEASSEFEVFVMTDMHDHPEVCRMLAENGFGCVPPERVLCSDYETHGEGCKEVMIRELDIAMFFDDHPGYLAAAADVPECAVFGAWPKPSEPYWHDDWKADGEFGRRRRRVVPGLFQVDHPGTQPGT